MLTQPPTPSPRRAIRRGLTLLELIIAMAILFSVLLPLSAAMSNATLKVLDAREQLSAPSIANMILNQLVSDELPEFEDDFAIMRGDGNVADFIQNYFPSLYNNLPDRTIETYARWEYQWEKVLIVQNEDDRYEPYEDGSEPDFGLDDIEDNATHEDDPDFLDPEEQASKPASRFVRVRLELNLPIKGSQDRDDRLQDSPQLSLEAFRPDKHVYVTFIDLDDFKESVEDAAPTDDANPDPDAGPGTNNTGGTNSGGTNSGGTNSGGANSGGTNTGGGN